MIYDWPATLGFRGIGFNGRGMTVGGPPTLTGQSQAGSLDAGFWIAELTGIPAPDAVRVKVYRALKALLEGGAHQIRVPVCDGQQVPWPVDPSGNLVTSRPPVPFSDDALFSDESGFWQPAIAAETVGAAAARAASIIIDFGYVGEVVGGEYFSIGDRLHVIKQILAIVGTQYMLSIWPPLREGAPDGTQVNFDHPVCRMRLVDESSGDLSLEYGRWGYPDMAFVEVFR